MFIKKCLMLILSVIAAQGADDFGFDDNGNGVSTVIEDNPFRGTVTVVDDGYFTIVDDDGNVTVVNGDGDNFTIVDDHRHKTNGGSVNVIMNKMMILSLLALFV
jgi:hypothetical protein